MKGNETTLAKAELYLCLGRAFATPDAPGLYEALRDALPADLEDLGARCDYPIPEALAEYRRAIAAVSDPQQLLVMYSRLFLVPGDRHPSLNLGTYLDGAVSGGSVTALDTCYARCGLHKDGAFRDLPDHIGVQLEFVAWLLASEAGASEQDTAPPPIGAMEFIARFVARWIGPLRADIEEASERFRLPNNPYLALARLLETAVRAEVGMNPTQTTPDADVDPEIARLRAQFAGRQITEEDLAIIRARLEADGLATDHVAIPVDARDRTMGMATMTPPPAPSHRIGCGA
jgi:TorA maturation chaperone TorD